MTFGLIIKGRIEIYGKKSHLQMKTLIIYTNHFLVQSVLDALYSDLIGGQKHFIL